MVRATLGALGEMMQQQKQKREEKFALLDFLSALGIAA